jgi:stage 0 sporulation protein B (sporulation initiation phosphotransferase)
MKKDWTTVELLSHSRHDWLNKVQLIKGNLSLHKYDRVNEIIQDIVIEAQNEARLSQLHTPQFAALLLTCNWNNFSFQVDYEVLEASTDNQFTINDMIASNWTSSFFECLQQTVQEFADNHLSITIERQQSSTCFFFDFRGIIKNRIELETFFASKETLIEVIVHEFSEKEFSLQVLVPYEK